MQVSAIKNQGLSVIKIAGLCWYNFTSFETPIIIDARKPIAIQFLNSF